MTAVWHRRVGQGTCPSLWALLVVCLACLAGAGLPGVASGQGGGSGQPPVPGPGKGVYLGAWVNPNGTQPLSAQWPLFDKRAGRKMAVLHYYSGWADPAPVAVLTQISGYGAIPLLDWACGNQTTTAGNGSPSGTGDQNIVAGDDDLMILHYAQALASYGKPVFMRWFWEMNLPTDPNHAANHCADVHHPCYYTPNPRLPLTRLLTPQECYISAWQRIWDIFHGKLAVHHETVDAPNVAFVWCPSVQTAWAAYYPGNRYVDWICADGYSSSEATPPNPSFATIFSPIYSWAQQKDPSAPFMVGETAAGGGPPGTSQGAVQATYLAAAEEAVLSGNPPMDNVQAFVYFDAIGGKGKHDWTLRAGPGFDAFCKLGLAFTFGEPAGSTGHC